MIDGGLTTEAWMENVRRVVCWFEKDPGDALVGEADLLNITLSMLQTLFGVPAENPMYDCWPVRSEHLEGLTPHVSVEIDLDRYDYFVDARVVCRYPG